MRKVRSKTTLRPLAAIMAGVVTSLLLWPVLVARMTPAASAAAPLVRDYVSRDRLIAFYERQIRENPRDQIEMRMLAQQYLQRFREQFDLGDIERAQRVAMRSLQLQPQGNTSALMALASAALSYHDFRTALDYERRAVQGEPQLAAAQAQVASLQMELGEYDRAGSTLAAIRTPQENPGVDAVRARLDELTGHLEAARAEIDAASRVADGDIGDPAYDRSWFHLRAGQLAFEAGDVSRAEREYRISLDDFPDNAVALMWEAKLFRGQGRWEDALKAASRSAALYPLPQTLGYEADTLRALGRSADASQTDALIDAEQRLYNRNGVNDRLLAVYYAGRRVHLDEALRAAESDLRKRGDEIYADDTMAWVLAAMGRWTRAYTYSERALRTGITDPDVQYHAGVIALETGRRDKARRLLRAALQENPYFDPTEAADARTRLERL